MVYSPFYTAVRSGCKSSGGICWTSWPQPAGFGHLCRCNNAQLDIWLLLLCIDIQWSDTLCLLAHGMYDNSSCRYILLCLGINASIVSDCTVHCEHLHLYVHLYMEVKDLFTLTQEVVAAMHMDCLQVAL